MDTARLYDRELQMFRNPVRTPDMATLRFLRWLAENSKLEHRIFGEPTGELASQSVDPQL